MIFLSDLSAHEDIGIPGGHFRVLTCLSVWWSAMWISMRVTTPSDPGCLVRKWTVTAISLFHPYINLSSNYLSMWLYECVPEILWTAVTVIVGEGQSDVHPWHTTDVLICKLSRDETFLTRRCYAQRYYKKNTYHHPKFHDNFRLSTSSTNIRWLFPHTCPCTKDARRPTFSIQVSILLFLKSLSINGTWQSDTITLW